MMVIMKKLSAVIITLNEELNIEACLQSLTFADEIVVIDANSTDQTKDLVKKFTEKCYSRDWEGYSSAKNFGIDKAENDWILSLDADERISDELRNSICKVLSESDLSAGYWCSRRTWFMGRWIRGGGWYPDRTIRLFDRTKGRFNDVDVHEKVELNGSTRRLTGDILHYSYRNLSDHICRIDKYSSLIAKKWLSENRRISRWKMFCRPAWEFFRKLVLKRSYIDGIPGWIIAGMHAYYVFLKYAKSYELRIRLKSPE